jgi:hypothetical protein
MSMSISRLRPFVREAPSEESGQIPRSMENPGHFNPCFRFKVKDQVVPNPGAADASGQVRPRFAYPWVFGQLAAVVPEPPDEAIGRLGLVPGNISPDFGDVRLGQLGDVGVFHTDLVP